MTTRSYTVSVSNVFEATSPTDAVSQMTTWLIDNAYKAGYRIDTDGSDETTFIDAEGIDWNRLTDEEGP